MCDSTQMFHCEDEAAGCVTSSLLSSLQDLRCALQKTRSELQAKEAALKESEAERQTAVQEKERNIAQLQRSLQDKEQQLQVRPVNALCVATHSHTNTHTSLILC